MAFFLSKQHQRTTQRRKLGTVTQQDKFISRARERVTFGSRQTYLDFLGLASFVNLIILIKFVLESIVRQEKTEQLKR